MAVAKIEKALLNMSTVSRQLFEESVISIPWSICQAKRSPKSIQNTRLMDQIAKFINEGFRRICNDGLAGQAEVLGLDFLTISMIKSYVLKEPAIRERIFYDLFYALEYPRGIYFNRQRDLSQVSVSPQDYVDELCKSLPCDWVVCALSIDVERDILYISRIGSKYQPSLYKLPMKRFATREGEVNGPGLSYSKMRAEFDRIMRRNKETTSNAKFCTTPKQRREWFATRCELDGQLESFLGEIENCWLGAFKGLFIKKEGGDAYITAVERFKSKLQNLLHQNMFSSKKAKLKDMVEIDTSILEMFLMGADSPSYEAAEDMIYFLLDLCQAQGLRVQIDEIDIEQLRDDVMDILALFRRDTEFLPSERGHLLLIPDRNCADLPWECLPCLRKTSVSRMPSVQSLKQVLKLKNSISSQKSFVVLNPTSDLMKTQTKFEKILQPYILLM